MEGRKNKWKDEGKKIKRKESKKGVKRKRIKMETLLEDSLIKRKKTGFIK